MLNFLRKLRIKEMNGKYLKYAFGEIVLVVIGILIALSINNWNELRKDRNYEFTMLKQVEKALISDSIATERFYVYRLRRKERALERLSALAAQPKFIPKDSLIFLINEMQIDFVYSYDAGPYEAIKLHGIEKIADEALRTELINFYDRITPLWLNFIQSKNDEYGPRIDLLTDQILCYKPGTQNDNPKVFSTLCLDNVLEHPAFLKLIYLEQEKAENQRDRLEVLIRVNSELQQMVKTYLNK